MEMEGTTYTMAVLDIISRTTEDTTRLLVQRLKHTKLNNFMGEYVGMEVREPGEVLLFLKYPPYHTPINMVYTLIQEMHIHVVD